MPTPKEILLLQNTTKASLAYLLPTHNILELPVDTKLDDLKIDLTLYPRLLTRCAIVLSNEVGAVRSVWLHQNVAFIPGQTIRDFALNLWQALQSANAFRKCANPPPLNNPSAAECRGWKNGSVACRCVLAIEDWADPATLNQPITGSRKLGSFKKWNLGALAQLVQATNDRQVFAPFISERMEFPNPPPPDDSTTVDQWIKLVLQLREPKTECP